MKFSNGCWLSREGVEIFGNTEVYSYDIKENKGIIDELVCCIPTHNINNRGDTLGGVNLTLHITSPEDGVFRLQTFHYKGVRVKSPLFVVNDKKVPLKVEVNEQDIIVTSGNATCYIKKENAKITFAYGDKYITSIKTKDLAYIKTDAKGFAYEDHESQAYMRGQVNLSVDEYIYGLGERFGPLIKNGQSVEMWNEDGGTSTELSYKNIPFFISNRGYGLFVNHPEKVSFEVGSELVKKVSFTVPSENLDFYVFCGPTMKNVMEQYTNLTGKPALPPKWSFGLWLSTSFTTNYDEETVNSFVDGMFQRDIPLTVFHFDCFWMKGFCWTDFVWDEKVFPDPVGMLKRLHEKGLHVCVWINPYIAQESCLFEEGSNKGYFIHRTNGDIWQWDLWQPGMAIVDFTNPEAKKWYQSKLEILVEMGVDCFKTDFGERIPVENISYYDDSDPGKMHNFYAYLYNETVYEVLARKKGKEDACLFARSATAGGQKFPVHWGGDCWSDYESMSESLRGGLSLTMSGFGYWSHDIGGFEDTSTPDVYKRWVAFGLLSSHSRLHGSWSYRVPWAYDEESVEVLRHFVKVKEKLMPYLYRMAEENSRTGIPMMRSMVMEFAEDKVCTFLDKQYMLGDSLLVAPVLNKEGMSSYYLPKGKWTNYFTGEVIEGEKWYQEKVDYFTIPLFIREGANDLIKLM